MQVENATTLDLLQELQERHPFRFDKMEPDTLTIVLDEETVKRLVQKGRKR